MTDTRTNDFFVMARVILKKPIAPIDDSDANTGSLSGYFVNVGVAAKDKNEAMQVISNALSDGNIDWSQSEWKSLETIDRSIADKAKGFDGAGIWYKSGRVFFSN
jgi:hypothetical protein